MACRVLIVEDDPEFRAEFMQAVQSTDDLQLAGSADDLPEGLRLLDALRPDVLLVDIGLPSGSGIELIRHAHVTQPHCDVMVVTVFGDERHVIECLAAGASGYLLKGTPEAGIVSQIRALRAGGSPISPVIARQLLLRFRPPAAAAIAPLATASPVIGNPRAAGASDNDAATLSAQEQTVLELAGKGYSYDEVAQLMKLSRHTIETYVRRIYRKLHVHNKAEALYEARKLGLVRD